MNCAIYKGRAKADAFLYVAEKDDFSRVPATLLKLLGSLEHVMDLELTPERRLARENVMDVMRHLSEQGWFLQLPPKDDDREPH